MVQVANRLLLSSCSWWGEKGHGHFSSRNGRRAPGPTATPDCTGCGMVIPQREFVFVEKGGKMPDDNKERNK